ncbi:MAG TPA: GatB/YqeY domain-containing protein, partial [Longimicrobium sp.]|nr:GatB/YqeY domain-containing protein [Longimicrobium sp.]
KEIEVGHELGDEEVQGVANSAIKRRREAAEQMRAGNREELARKEDEEAALLQGYLPAQLGEDEVRALVREAVAAGAKDIGGVMKQVMPKAKGRFDGKELNRIVREELAG